MRLIYQTLIISFNILKMDKAKMASLFGMALVSIVSLDRCRYSGKIYLP